MNTSSQSTRATLAVSIVLFALLASACGERDEPTGAIAAPFPVTVQGAGEEPATLEAPPRRVVALDPGSAAVVARLGGGETLVGAPAGFEVAGADPQPVLRDGDVDVAAVAALGPDLVVATPENDPVAVAQVERQTSAIVYVQPSRTVREVIRGIVDLGALLGAPALARQLVAQIERDVQEIDALLADADPVKVFVDTGLFVTIQDRSIFGDLIRRAQGVNVAANPALGPVSPLDLAEADPDVYLTTSDSGLTLQGLRANRDTTDLRAIQDGRFAILPVELVASPGPSLAEAYQAIAVALHPDAFR